MHQTEESKDYHQNYEYGVDEFYDNGDGTHGLIATGFINYYMPSDSVQDRRYFYS